MNQKHFLEEIKNKSFELGFDEFGITDLENFEFISTLEIPYFGLSMVVQDSNYKDIPKLIKIRDKYFPNGYVYFQKITNWETFSEEEFKKKAVWKENHSEHKEFVKILKENVTDRLEDRVASNMVDLK